jgi:hypothetical protein
MKRSQGKASQASYKRAKELIKGGKWILDDGQETGIHPVLHAKQSARKYKMKPMMHSDSSTHIFRPTETVFEVGIQGLNEAAALMQNRRKALGKAAIRAQVVSSSKVGDGEPRPVHTGVEMADETGIEAQPVILDDLTEVFMSIHTPSSRHLVKNLARILYVAPREGCIDRERVRTYFFFVWS